MPEKNSKYRGFAKGAFVELQMTRLSRGFNRTLLNSRVHKSREKTHWKNTWGPKKTIFITYSIHEHFTTRTLSGHESKAGRRWDWTVLHFPSWRWIGRSTGESALINVSRRLRLSVRYVMNDMRSIASHTALTEIGGPRDNGSVARPRSEVLTHRKKIISQLQKLASCHRSKKAR